MKGRGISRVTTLFYRQLTPQPTFSFPSEPAGFCMSIRRFKIVPPFLTAHYISPRNKLSSRFLSISDAPHTMVERTVSFPQLKSRFQSRRKICLCSLYALLYGSSLCHPTGSGAGQGAASPMGIICRNTLFTEPDHCLPITHHII